MLEKVHKAFISYEKEENWLNQMSSTGMALRTTGWCTYYFEKDTPGEYIYRIELLPELPSHPQSKSYINFLEENGVECVGTYRRWAYFRKKAADGPFDLYSDIDSRVSHYKRVLFFYGIVCLLNLFAVGVNIYAVVLSAITQINAVHQINFICAVISTTIALMFSSICISYIRKIHKLKKQKLLTE